MRSPKARWCWLFALTACVRAVPLPAPAPAPAAAVQVVEATPAPAPVLAPPPPSAAELAARRVDGLVAAMSVEQKVGQVLMVGFNGTRVDDEIRGLVRSMRIGGVVMFKRNIASPEQIARFNEDLRALLEDGVPPFIAVDQEGGNVVRISEGAVVLPGNMALGATRAPHLAYEAGLAQALDLKLLGFNMNLAPVLDVNLNPKNPVIGIRSFGSRAELVSEFGTDFARGQQDGNLVTIVKHFPGHGSTAADSHKALPVMSETEAEVLEQVAPFEAAMKLPDGLDGVMTAHVAIPKVTGDDLPATLNPKIIDGLLRKRIGFQGLVLTDELEMDSIAARYGVGPAAVMAINAGADMVLVPWRPEKKVEAHQALLDAARSGKIATARLDEAVRRIVSVKLKRGLFDAPEPLDARMKRLGTRRDIAQRIAQESVTLLKSDPKVFPLRPRKRIAVITAEGSLGSAVQRRSPRAQVMVVPAYPTPEQRPELRERARELAASDDVELVVVGIINSRQLELVTMAAATGKPVIVVAMGLPYLVEQVEEARTLMALYSFRDVATEAAAAALFGEQGTPGKLPVALWRYPYGHGLDPVGDELAKKTGSPAPP
jgi:beta-N-acetylhexosaminidase